MKKDRGRNGLLPKLSEKDRNEIIAIIRANSEIYKLENFDSYSALVNMKGALFLGLKTKGIK